MLRRCLSGFCLCAFIGAQVSGAVQTRVSVPFDGGWRFLKDDPPQAETAGFDDSRWAVVSLPNDWSILSPFDPNSLAAGAGAFLPAGIGWYRKAFLLPGPYKGQRLFIEFDGVMANSDVWINGVHLGKRPNGYVSFRYELTPHLHQGLREMNLLAVRVDNSAQPASRWYAGAGIYRHVRLLITGPVHLEPWSTVVSILTVSGGEAVARVEGRVTNQSDAPCTVSAQVRISGPDGNPIRTVETERRTIAPGSFAGFRQDLPVPFPQLWDVARPAMYQAAIRVRESGDTVDEETTPFGIRVSRFDPATGFWLNGRNLKIKGVALHHDGGALGASVPLSIWERRLSALKELGVNAIRTAHNPASPEFLDLCDRMGLLVMEELFDVWQRAKVPFDYHLAFDQWSNVDAADTVRRDRNHPSLVLYSAGNEIRDTSNPDLAKRLLQSLLDVIHREDSSRPVTMALFRPNATHAYENGLADMLDVIGQNYREDEILAAHAAKPARRIVGTENGHDLKTWLALRDHPAYAGQFIWAGFDYLGESDAWPRIGTGSGLFDRTGRPRPIAFERKSWWSDESTVYIARRAAAQAGRSTVASVLSDWTPAQTSPHLESVEVYSNCEAVELFLNGASLGSRPRPADDSPRRWSVPYTPGVLEAIGRNHGQEAARHQLRTAGTAARIHLLADRAQIGMSWDDVVLLRAVVVDAEGTQVPRAADAITFQGKGPGIVVAVDNGANSWHGPFLGTSCPAFEGQCVAILRGKDAEGPITMTASAPGLETSNPVTIKVTRTASTPFSGPKL